MPNECRKNSDSDALIFLSDQFKEKLKNIAEETAKFMLLSKFKKLDEKWLEVDGEASETIKKLSELKSAHVFNLVGELYVNGLALSDEQESEVLKYVYRETDKQSVEWNLGRCKRDFYQPMFFKQKIAHRKGNTHERRNTEMNNVKPQEAPSSTYGPNNAQFTGVPIYYDPQGHQAVTWIQVPIHQTYPQFPPFYPPPQSQYNQYPRYPFNKRGTRPYKPRGGRMQRPFIRTQDVNHNDVTFSSGPNNRPYTATTSMEHSNNTSNESTSNLNSNECVVLVETETESNGIRTENGPNKVFHNRSRIEQSSGEIEHSDPDVEIRNYFKERVEKKYVSCIAGANFYEVSTTLFHQLKSTFWN